MIQGKRTSLTSLVRIAVLAASMCVVIAALRAASSVLAPVVGALFFALIVVSPVPWLSRLVPRAVAGTLVGLVAIGFLVAIGALVPRWTSELAELVSANADRIQALPARLHALAQRSGLVGPELPRPALPAEWMLEASGAAVRLTAGVLSAIVFLGFILAELAGLHAKLAVAFGPHDRRIAMVRRVSTRLTVYFRVKTIASLVTGILAAVGCAAVGVDLPLLWGLVAFLLNYAPTVGSFVASIPPVLLAALTLGWERAAVLAGIYLVVNGTIGGIIEPKILGQRMGLSPLVVLVSLIFWGWVWGPIGLLLAVPMTMVFKIVLEQTEELRPLAVLLGSAGSAQSSPEGRAARAAAPRLTDDDGH